MWKNLSLINDVRLTSTTNCPGKHQYLMISASNNGAGVSYRLCQKCWFPFQVPYSSVFLMRITSYCMPEQYDSVPASQDISWCFFKFIYKHLTYQTFFQFLVAFFFQMYFIKFAKIVPSLMTDLYKHPLKIK